MPLTERDMLIARVLIDSIDADGFDADLEEITEALGRSSRSSSLTRLRVYFTNSKTDPVGVGARGIAESLAIQLAAMVYSAAMSRSLYPWSRTISIY